MEIEYKILIERLVLGSAGVLACLLTLRTTLAQLAGGTPGVPALGIVVSAKRSTKGQKLLFSTNRETFEILTCDSPFPLPSEHFFFAPTFPAR
jgi:hypothetical protein